MRYEHNPFLEGVTKGKWRDLGFTELKWDLEDELFRTAGANFQGRSMIIWRGANSAKIALEEPGCWRSA